MSRRISVRLRLTLLGAGIVLLVGASPASARAGDSVSANVVGVVTRTTTPCTPNDPLPQTIPSGPGRVAEFSQVIVTGTWVAGASPLTPFTGAVNVTPVAACVSAVGNPPPSAPALVNQGSIGSAIYSGAGVVSTISGSLAAGGRFVQAGSVAIATDQFTSYCINGTACAATVPLVAVMSVVPAGSAGVGNQDDVAGIVVGAG